MGAFVNCTKVNKKPVTKPESIGKYQAGSKKPEKSYIKPIRMLNKKQAEEAAKESSRVEDDKQEDNVNINDKPVEVQDPKEQPDEKVVKKVQIVLDQNEESEDFQEQDFENENLVEEEKQPELIETRTSLLPFNVANDVDQQEMMMSNVSGRSTQMGRESVVPDEGDLDILVKMVSYEQNTIPGKIGPHRDTYRVRRLSVKFTNREVTQQEIKDWKPLCYQIFGQMSKAAIQAPQDDSIKPNDIAKLAINKDSDEFKEALQLIEQNFKDADLNGDGLIDKEEHNTFRSMKNDNLQQKYGYQIDYTQEMQDEEYRLINNIKQETDGVSIDDMKYAFDVFLQVIGVIMEENEELTEIREANSDQEELSRDTFTQIENRQSNSLEQSNNN